MAIILFLSFSKGYLFLFLLSSSMNSNLFSFVSYVYYGYPSSSSSFSFFTQSRLFQTPPFHYLSFFPSSPPHPIITPQHSTSCYNSLAPPHLAGTWPFVSILAFALALTSNCAVIEMPRLTLLYLKAWALKLAWKF
jgi:hypothetical protein